MSSNGKGTLRERILAKDDSALEIVAVPEWDETVEVRSMTGKERSRVMKEYMVDGELDMERLYPVLIIACTYDPDTGEQVFTPADTEALNKKNAGPLERVAQAALRVSGLAPGAVEAAGKASLPTPSVASTST